MISMEGAAAAIIVAVLVSRILTYFVSRRENQHLYTSTGERPQIQITQCPNPNCVRCRRYKQVNIVAKQSLSWVVTSLSTGPNEDDSCLSSKHNSTVEEELQRIIHAVRVGPKLSNEEEEARISHGGETLRNSCGAPILGQEPTVLLVRGLSAKPIVTDLHKIVCKALSQEEIRVRILKEYLDSQAPSQPDGQDSSNSINRRINGGTPRSVQWLSNDVNETGSWNVLHLLNQGEWKVENMLSCPETTKVVKALSPHLLEDCIFGNAFISVIHPGTNIEPHCGPSNVRHRLHLPLNLPGSDSSSGGARLIVGGIEQSWKIGEVFCFDDSICHSVSYPPTTAEVVEPQYKSVYGINLPTDRAMWKNTDMGARVVLIVDLWHPELSRIERNAITKLYAPNVR